FTAYSHTPNIQVAEKPILAVFYDPSKRVTRLSFLIYLTNNGNGNGTVMTASAHFQLPKGAPMDVTESNFKFSDEHDQPVGLPLAVPVAVPRSLSAYVELPGENLREPGSYRVEITLKDNDKPLSGMPMKFCF